jgi:hypothetical protein
MGNIYKITNLINGKIYVGLTRHSIDERWKNHKKDINKERNKNRALYRAFKKYGIENFKMELIESVELCKLGERERYWIDCYDSYYNGYNETRGGEGSSLYCVDDFVDDFLEGKTIKEIAKEHGCDRDTVSRYLEDAGINTRQNSTANRSIPVLQYTRDKVFLQKFSSMSDAARFLRETENTNGRIDGIAHHISQTTRGLRNSAYGYIWRLDI